MRTTLIVVENDADHATTFTYPPICSFLAAIVGAIRPLLSQR